jgi:hypothetical protein
MVYAKPVEVAHGKIRAVALFNGEDIEKKIRITFNDIQLSDKVQVRDLWTHTNLGEFISFYETMVPAHGSALLRIEGEASFDQTRFQGESAFMNLYSALLPGNNARVERVTGLSSGGYKMSQLGKSAANWAEFREVHSTAGGKYTFKLFYYSPENWNLSVTVNEKEYWMENLNSGDINTRAEAYLEIELNQGNNVIRLANANAWAPDIDKFELIAEGATEEKDNFEINDSGSHFPAVAQDTNSLPPAKVIITGKNLSIEGKGIINVQLYSFTGQLLGAKSGSSPVFSLPQPGYYFVFIRYSNRIETKKIIL